MILIFRAPGIQKWSNLNNNPAEKKHTQHLIAYNIYLYTLREKGGTQARSFHPQATQRPQVAIWALAGTDKHDFPVGQPPTGHARLEAWGGKQSVDSKHVWHVPRHEVAQKMIEHVCK